MNKYVIIFHVGAPIDETPEFIEANMAWFKKLGDKLIDSGNPFNPDAEAHISMGKIEHKPDTAAGYSLINAGSLDEAIELVKTHPLANMEGCSTNVYETMAM